MMTRKRWITLGAAIAVLCLVLGALGVAFLAHTIPGVARLFRGDPPAPTAISIGERNLAGLLPTATLTAAPTLTEVPSSPTVTPSAIGSASRGTATAGRPTELPTEAVILAEGSSPTSTPPGPATPAWTPSPTSVPATPTRPAATATPRTPWIAFESSRGEYSDYEIMVMAPDGSRQTNLTMSWADDLAPTWAPDGRHIAFVSFRDTLSGKWGLGKGSIYAMDFDPGSGKGGAVWRVTDGGGSEGWPSWSPDGRRIAFHSNRSGNLDIWIANADGTGLAQLTRHPDDDYFPDWSPDGKKIAFTSDRSGNEDVWVIDVAAALRGEGGSTAVNLTNSRRSDRYPFWSPDGTQLSFNSDREGSHSVYIMNADGSNPRNVSQSPDSAEGLADWSPDGKYLVFYSDRTGDKEVYILDLASLAWTNISNHPANDEFCAWSP